MEKDDSEMTSEDMIRELTNCTKEKCLEWVKNIEGETFLVDPIDHEEISAHYGASHAAVAFLMLGIKSGDYNLEVTGIKLLTSVLNRWNASAVLPDFHNDFNNFALCVAYEHIFEKHKDLAVRIKETVLNTADSSHDTVNWIPMRWFVNKCRYDWTKEEKYQSACFVCAGKIKMATYGDGFIDDRVPKGMSFNLQYDVATVAVLQYLRVHGEKLDISEEVGALLNAVAPDGDINYLGRGMNQIFAWGMWLYLLASADLDNDLQKALAYCADKIPIMLKNNNLMLNNWNGREKYLWWDYHYCSVYTAHLLFWLVLALEDAGKKSVVPVLSEVHDSGVEILRKDGWFVATFAGRAEYLAERGPVIVAIGREDGRMLVKGSFGPWYGAFGNKYVFSDVVIKNYFGLLKMKSGKDWYDNRILRKFIRRKPNTASVIFQPVFVQPIIDVNEHEIMFTWDYFHKGKLCVTFPTMNDCLTSITVKNRVIPMINTGFIRNQYSFLKLYQSHADSYGRVTFSIRI